MRLARLLAASLLLALTLIGSASCGFTLRTENTSALLPNIGLSPKLSRDVRLAIERQARASRIGVNQAATGKTSMITVIEEQVNSRWTRLDPLGRATELSISVQWKVANDKPQGPPIYMEASESVGLSEDSLLGYEKERRRIVETLREQLAEQLLTRLALRKKADAMNAPVSPE